MALPNSGQIFRPTDAKPSWGLFTPKPTTSKGLNSENTGPKMTVNPCFARLLSSRGHPPRNGLELLIGFLLTTSVSFLYFYWLILRLALKVKGRYLI